MNRISLSDKYVLITGAAGFIGANLAMRIMTEEPSCRIVGLDSLNDYYDVSIKEYRLDQIKKTAETTGASWEYIKGSIADKDLVNELFTRYSFSVVVNLAAQAGVRYSLINPDAYIETNIVGFYNIVEACRHSYDGGQTGVEHLVYASSSSVYGTNSSIPYSVAQKYSPLFFACGISRLLCQTTIYMSDQTLGRCIPLRGSFLSAVFQISPEHENRLSRGQSCHSKQSST